MEKNEITKMRKEEYAFLKSELEKIDTQIKALSYDKYPNKQEKLWELREKVKANLNKFIKEYPALFD